MTQQYSNENSGALFKNEEKITLNKPNWPDYNGSINVDGKDLWISAWIKKSKAGKSYMSLSVSEKEPKGQSQYSQQTPAAGPDVGDGDNFPF